MSSKMILVFIIFVLFLCKSEIICSQQVGNQDMDKENAELIYSIRNAVKNGLKFDALTKEVKKPPVLNTKLEIDRILFSKGSTEKDPDHLNEFLNLSKCHPLVYWKTGKTKIGLVKIVGVYYDKDEKPRVFFALLGD